MADEKKEDYVRPTFYPEKISVRKYSDWHKKLSGKCMALDIDMVECRWVKGQKGQLKPVALTELFIVPENVKSVDDNYFTGTLKGFMVDRVQGRFALMVAEKLNVKAYLVGYKEDLSEFYAYNLTDGLGWKHFTEPEYMAFIEGL